MKRLALIIPLALLALPAHARNFHCTMTMMDGSSFGWSWQSRSIHDWTEIRAFKNSVPLTHAPGERPRWTMERGPGFYTLTYLPDPGFSVVIRADAMRNHRGVFHRAMLTRNGAAFAQSGTCAFEDQLNIDYFANSLGEGTYE